jgi:hypothetical protein
LFNLHAYNANRQAYWLKWQLSEQNLSNTGVCLRPMAELAGYCGNADLPVLLHTWFCRSNPIIKDCPDRIYYVSENGEYHLNSFNEADVEIEAFGHGVLS